jgi:histidinol-phosphatase (PHP family)
MRVDNHNHIIQASIEDMVAAARKNKAEQFSITEHVAQFKALRNSIGFGSMHGRGRIFEDAGEYRKEFSKVDGTADPPLAIRMGLEVDFSPRYERKLGEWVNQEKWDILLCSIHEYRDGSELETHEPPLTKSEAGPLWREYFQLLTEALESDFVPFSVLTHPVRMYGRTSYVPEDLDDLLLGLARTAKRRNKALELNGKDLETAPALVERLAMACSKAGCAVSMGSDAHFPDAVFRNMGKASSLVETFNLRVL